VRACATGAISARRHLGQHVDVGHHRRAQSIVVPRHPGSRMRTFHIGVRSSAGRKHPRRGAYYAKVVDPATATSVVHSQKIPCW